MTARTDTYAVMQRFQARGLTISFEDANTLRRAELTLQRWGELECGDGNGYIQRDEGTGIPRYFNCRARYLDPSDPRAWHRIPDRERGALRRVAEVCKRNGLHYYHQTDPRGCALYVSNQPISDNDYSSRAVAVCA